MIKEFINMIFGLFSKKDKEEKKEEQVVVKEKEQLKYLFTKEELYQINSNLNKNECDYYYEALNEIMPQYDINTKLRICHFLAQILHESGHFRYKSENLNYSAKALRSVFPKYFKTDEIAAEYARKPEKISNRVYANRMGNGDEASGDGWKFRGRGLIQLTGMSNYKICGEALGIDLLKLPDLITSDPKICVKTACWFWSSKKLNDLADNDDIKTITKRINGGFNGLDDRCKILDLAKGIIKK